VSQALNSNQEEDARSALELFVELAEIDPTSLRPHLATIVNAMFTISTANTLEDCMFFVVIAFAFLSSFIISCSYQTSWLGIFDYLV
jgi:hypothetical protein